MHLKQRLAAVPWRDLLIVGIVLFGAWRIIRLWL